MFLDWLFSDEVQYVSHYTPPVKYKRTDEALVYSIDILDETYINNHEIKNKYTQDLIVNLDYKGNSGIYHFDCKIANEAFKLTTALTQQGRLLQDLTTITEHLKITVTENGIIKGVSHKDIVKKWDSLKKQLLKTHRGAEAHNFIAGIDKRIQDESLFLEEIKKVKLFGLLFGGYQTMSEHDKPKNRKLSNVIKFLPMTFKEKVIAVKEDEEKKERHITLKGSMNPLPQETQAEIQAYFKHLKMGSELPFLSNHHQEIVMNLETGYPKSVTFDMELINGRGYVRKKNINLRLKNNG